MVQWREPTPISTADSPTSKTVDLAAVPPGTVPNRVLWRVLTLIALGLIVAAIATSVAFPGRPYPDATQPLTPPFDRPAVAAAMPTTQDISTWYGKPMILWYQGPPAEKIYFATTPAIWDFRRMTVQAAWSQRWLAPDGYGAVTLSVIQFRASGYNKWTSLGCSPTTTWPIAGATVAGIEGHGTGGVTGCAKILRGRELFIAEIDAFGPDAVARVRTTLEATVAAASPHIADSPAQLTIQRFTAGRVHILWAWMMMLIFVGLAVTVPSTLLDKSAWLRLNPRTWGRRTNRPQLDVEPAARALRARLRAVAAWRFATLIWTLRLAEEVHWGAIRTVAALVFVYLTGILVQRWIVTRGRPRGRIVTRHTPASIAVLIVGAAGSIAVIAIALGVLQFAVSFGSVGPATAGVTQWQANQYQTVFEFIAVWILGNALIPLSAFRRLARRFLRGKMPQGVPPVLVLRTFADDGVGIRIKDADRSGLLDHFLLKRRESLEQIATFALAPFGAPIAVGQPGEALPPGMGATRLYFSEAEWRSKVDAISQNSSLICVVLGRSESLAWELSHLKEMGRLSKTVFVMPPVPLAEQRSRLALLSERLAIPWQLLDVSGMGRRFLAMSVPASGKPMIAIAASQDDVSYERAISTCVQALIQSQSETRKALDPNVLAQYSDVGRPPVSIVPRGASQKQKGAWRLSAAWNIAIPLLLLTALAQSGPGTNIPESGHNTKYVAIPAGHGANRLVGGQGTDYWFIQDQSTLVHWDTAKNSTSIVADVTDSYVLTDAYADGQVVLSTRDASAEVWLEGHDVTTGRQSWKVPLGESPSILTADSQRIWVPQPTKHAVEVRSLADGSVVRTIKLPCQPWSVDLTKSGAAVTCPAENKIIRLAASGEVGAAEVTPGSVSQVLNWSGTEYWVMPADMKIVRADGDDTIWMSFPFAGYTTQVDALGNALACVGYDRVSVFVQASGGPTVERLNTQTITRDLMVTSDGKVFYSTDNMMVLLTPNRQ